MVSHKIDWMRRIGDFEDVIKEYNEINLKDETWHPFLQFQLEKAKNKDNSCYSIRDVIRWNND